MRRTIANLAFLMIMFAVQNCIFPFIPFLSAAPNLILILTFSYSFIYGSRSGIFYGLAAGLLMDLFYSAGAFGFLYNLYIYFFRFFIRAKMQFGYYFLHIIVPEIIISLLFTLLIYRFFLWYNRKLEILDRKQAVN